ncbi:FecR domain-containing protein [Ramlibacter monticola]|uniref:FecR domain-containing protein n=2 Tax=Ramlibacter monticola TaxID=1926872 RepID=A0A937CVV6_9BURK|nr:FecR domain-containing protein [Ramlibacter monticola]
MVRGGFRAVTGLISKGSPDAARIQTQTATIGIRGTDFDARLCARDCGAESAQIQDSARPNAVQASAKVVSAQGEVSAVDGAGERRRLVEGGSVYPGEVVETARGSQAVLAFRDESRVTLGSQTRFRLDNFVYDDQNPADGRFLASILRGSVRALTGLIGRANNRNVGFGTATATIGIRGTGFDVVCTGPCAGELASFGPADGLTVWTWLGTVSVTPQGQTALQVLQAGQGLFISPAGTVQPVTTQPPMEGARPDQVIVPPKLFAMAGVSDAEEGLFVFVRDGHIEIASAREVLHLGKGEAGFAGANGETLRPETVPKFIEFDRMPLPTARNPMLTSVLNESGIRSSHVCR